MLPSLYRMSVVAALMAPAFAAAGMPAAQPPTEAQRIAYAPARSAQQVAYVAAQGVLVASAPMPYHPMAGHAQFNASATRDDNPQSATAPAAPRKAGESASLINAALASSIDPEFEGSALALAFLGLIGLIARRGTPR